MTNKEAELAILKCPNCGRISPGSPAAITWLVKSCCTKCGARMQIEKLAAAVTEDDALTAWAKALLQPYLDNISELCVENLALKVRLRDAEAEAALLRASETEDLGITTLGELLQGTTT